VGHPEHRLRLRGTHHSGTSRAEVGAPVSPLADRDLEVDQGDGRAFRLPLDGVVIPAFLLLIARDILLHDPHRVLGWRLLHEPALAAAAPSWMAPLLPRPAGEFDLDPVALLLGAVATAAAAIYLIAVVRGARPRVRAAVLILASTLLVVIPTLAFVAMGFVTGRPYGQDGGVVQLPLALERILDGRTPYGADYSASMLGRQARVSDFWASYGENPILHHHAYLPGTHALMLPFYITLRPLIGFDPRLVTLIAYGVAAWLAALVVSGPSRKLTAAAVVALNPLVYWQQTFGANDLLMAALLLGAVWFSQKGRASSAAALVGLACATKQLAWPFAPFLLVYFSGLRSVRELRSADRLRRLARASATAAGAFLLVVAPVALLDPRAFWADIVGYNVGLRGSDAYPLGGTPGLGFANLLIYAGWVRSLREHVSFGPFYLLVVPLVLALLVRTMRAGRASYALMAGAATLVAALYFSRVFHPNYLILAAVLIPVGLLMDDGLAADVVVVPLLLFASAVEIAEREMFRATFAQVVDGRRILGPFAPAAGPELTHDPVGLGLSALLSALAVAYLVAGLFHPGPRWRASLTVVAVSLGIATPSWIVIQAGRDGPVRAQDPWVADVVRAEATPAPVGLAPVVQASVAQPTVVQAWSTSFRRDPPAPVRPSSPGGPGARSVGITLRTLGLGDPRVVVLAAVAVLAGLAGRLASGAVPLFVSAVLLTPAAASAVVFGSPAAIFVGGVLLARALAQTGWEWSAAIVMGGAATVVPESLVIAPLVLLERPGVKPARVALGTLLGCALVAVPAFLFGPDGLTTTLLPVRAEPGTGLPNLWVYFGVEASLAARWFARALPVLVGAWAWVWALRQRGRYDALVPVSLFSILLALTLSGFSGLLLAAPVAFLMLAAIQSC
jgi:Glycosyltransferase family 87